MYEYVSNTRAGVNCFVERRRQTVSYGCVWQVVHEGHMTKHAVRNMCSSVLIRIGVFMCMFMSVLMCMLVWCYACVIAGSIPRATRAPPP